MGASALARASTYQPRAFARAWALAALLAAATVVLCIFGAVRAIGDLETMQADIHHMNDRLAVLEAMNGKLGQLNTMSNNLDSMRQRLDLTIGQLRQANDLLVTTNGKLDVANGSMKTMVGTMRGMSRQLQSVADMRADIHDMDHKLSGSFLFRGVK
jgi:methyl-accepting chemotaxis protein